MIIDAWMQHFGKSQLTHPMFASLRRWTRQSFAPVTPEMTIAALDEGRVSMGLAAAWCGPEGWMISNDEDNHLAYCHEELLRLAKQMPNSPLVNAMPDEVALADGKLVTARDASRDVVLGDAQEKRPGAQP